MKRRAWNLLLTCLSFLYLPFRGRAIQKCTPKRIAVIYPTRNIGDMVCITPLLRAIKKHNSAIEIVVIGTKQNGELLSHNDDVSVYLDVSKSFWGLVRQLRLLRIDAGVVINMDITNVAMFFLANIGSISCLTLDAAYKKYEAKPYRLVSLLVHRVSFSPGAYLPRTFLGLLTLFGIVSCDVVKKLGYDTDSLEHVKNELSQLDINDAHTLIAIAPGAGSDLKRWPADRFATVANLLYKKYHTPIAIIGGPHDQDAVQEMITNLDAETIYWNPGPQSMSALKATLHRSLLTIGNDSGAIHVAEALGSATVTIAGATSVGEHMEEDMTHRILHSTVGGAMYHAYIGDESVMDPVLAKQQMEAITVESVMNCVCEVCVQKGIA